MAQVEPIQLETDTASVKKTNENGTANTGIDFDPYLEKEKAKLLLPFPMSIFGSFTNTPMSFENKMDGAVSTIGASYGANKDNISRYADHSNNVQAKPAANTEQKTSTAVSAAPQQQTSAQAVSNESSMVNKYFIGEFQLTSDFFNYVSEAKGRIGGLEKVDIDALVSQMQDRIKSMSEKGRIELNIQLKPDSLGSVSMTIIKDKGVITVNIFADKMAKQALQENIGELELALKKANVNLGVLSVLSDTEKRQNKRGRDA